MASTYLRKTTLQDLPTVSKIIDSAKAFLKSQGIDQWQDGYPALPDLQSDVTNQIGYVLIIDGQIAGTAALLHDHDKNYEPSLMTVHGWDLKTQNTLPFIGLLCPPISGDNTFRKK